MPNFISEDDIEQALLRRLAEHHGFEILNAYTAQREDLKDGSGRGDKRQVVLVPRLRTALAKLNPTLPAARRSNRRSAS